MFIKTLPVGLEAFLEKINSNDGLWGFIAVAIIFFGWITGFFKKAWNYSKNIFRVLFPGRRLPKETLRFVVLPHSSFWNFGTKTVGKRKRHIMFISCDLYLTNITRGDILVTASYLRRPRSEATTPMVKAFNSIYYGRYTIPPGVTTNGSFNYTLDEIVRKKGEELVSDLVVIDQLGNEHVVKNVRFKSR